MLPHAYKTGIQEFYGRDYFVDQRTYIPNKETEFLVDSLLKELTSGQTVLDVGTGCGSIAITLKLEKPMANITACDISEEALEVAKKNSATYKLNIQFFVSNYVDNPNIPCPDFIIADLPWGSPETILHKGGMDMLQYMPKISLFHPNGPLGAQLALFESIKRRGWKPYVFIETGLLSRKSVAEIIPKTIKWEYLTQGNYSITILRF